MSINDVKIGPVIGWISEIRIESCLGVFFQFQAMENVLDELDASLIHKSCNIGINSRPVRS